MKAPRLLISPILLEAISEGLYLAGHKVWSKQVQVFLIASWFLIAFIFALDAIQRNVTQRKVLARLLGHYIIIYVLLRFVCFNYVHNLSAGLPLMYIGNVSFIDRILALATGAQTWMLIIAQVICLVFIYFIVKRKL